MKKRGRYPKEFKLEAVRLLKEGAKPALKIIDFVPNGAFIAETKLVTQ